MEKAQLEGIRVPKFYIGNVELQNRGDSAGRDERRRQNSGRAVAVWLDLPGALSVTW